MKTFEKRLYSLIFIGIIVFVISCSSESNKWKKEMKEFVNSEIVFPNNIIPLNLPESVGVDDLLSSEFKIIKFLDSTECAECRFSQLMTWDDYYIEHRESDYAILCVISESDFFEVKRLIDKFCFSFICLIDTDNSFKNLNLNLPTNSLLNTFLLRGNKVLLVGDPSKNSKINDLYIRMLETRGY